MIQTLALVVGLLIALSIDAINQLPIASVCDAPRRLPLININLYGCIYYASEAAKSANFRQDRQ